MRTILICGFAAMLAGCAPAAAPTPEPNRPGPTAPSNLPPLEPVPRDESAGRSGMDSMTWIYGPPGQYEDGRPANLLYSARASDETLLAMRCEGANVRITLMRSEGARSPYPFTLKSGARSVNLSGSTSGSGETRAEAIAPTNHAVFSRMAETGEFAVVEQGEEFPANAINETERQQIRSFFTACG